MSNYIGDFATGSRIDLDFTTVDSTGAPTALTSGSACVRQIGVSTGLSTVAPVGVAAITTSGGLNHITIFTGSSSTYYVVGTDYHIYLGNGTVSSVSAIGYAVGHFSLRNRAYLYPTTAGRTLDVSTGGEAGLDWANIGSPTTAQNLSGTNIDTDQVVASVTGAVGSVTGAVGSVAANGVSASSLAADAIAEIADGVWDEDATGHQTQGTFGQVIGDSGSDSDTIWALVNTNLDAAVSSRLAPTVAARTLDVSAGGEAGLDWANIGSPTTTQNLSGTTIAAVTSTGSFAQAVWDQATVGHVTAGTFGGMLDSLPTTAEIATATEIAEATWDLDATAHQTQGTFGQAIGDPGADTSTIWGLANTNLDATVSSRLAPTVAARTLDVSAGGEAGLDWANIGSPTTAQNLSATNIDVDQVVASVSGAVGSVTGAVGSVTGAVGSVTGNVGGNVTGSVGSLAAQAKADVNTEVLDVLNVDTFAQPGQGTPASTTTIRLMLNYLYKAWRNRTTQTATETALYNDDAATVDQKASFSDDGSTADRGEIATGP